MEYSVVGIPANQDAVQIENALDMCESDEMRMTFKQMLLEKQICELNECRGKLISIPEKLMEIEEKVNSIPSFTIAPTFDVAQNYMSIQPKPEVIINTELNVENAKEEVQEKKVETRLEPEKPEIQVVNLSSAQVAGLVRQITMDELGRIKGKL